MLVILPFSNSFSNAHHKNLWNSSNHMLYEWTKSKARNISKTLDENSWKFISVSVNKSSSYPMKPVWAARFINGTATCLLNRWLYCTDDDKIIDLLYLIKLPSQCIYKVDHPICINLKKSIYPTCLQNVVHETWLFYFLIWSNLT